MTKPEKPHHQHQLSYMLRIKLKKRDPKASDPLSPNSFSNGIIKKIKAIFSVISVLSPHGLEVDLDHKSNENNLGYQYSAVILFNQGKTTCIQNLIETVFNFINLAVAKNKNGTIKSTYLFDLLNQNKEQFEINDFTIKNKVKLIEEQNGLIKQINTYEKKMRIFFQYENMTQSLQNMDSQQELFILNINNPIEVETKTEEITGPESMATDDNYSKNKTNSTFKDSNTGKNSDKKKKATLLELIYLSTNPKLPSIFREGNKMNAEYFINPRSLQTILLNFDRFRSKAYKYKFPISSLQGRCKAVTLADVAFDIEHE